MNVPTFQGVNPMRILIESLSDEGDDRFIAQSFEAPAIAYGATPENALVAMIKTLAKTAEEHLRVHGTLLKGFYQDHSSYDPGIAPSSFFTGIASGAKPQWHPLPAELAKLGLQVDGLLVLTLGADKPAA